MALAQQASVIIEAAEQDLLGPNDILRWADARIVSLEHTPRWLIELSTVNPAYLQDFIRILREHSNQSLPLHLRIQIIVLGWKTGALSLQSSLQKLFKILIIEGWSANISRDLLDVRLSDALADWDQLEEPDSIDSNFSSKFEMLFHDYLKDAQEIAQVLGWIYGS